MAIDIQTLLQSTLLEGYTGSIGYDGSLSTLNLDISGGNLRLIVSPVNASTTYKAIIAKIVV